MRDICENLIEENSKFNVCEDEESYFDKPVIYKNGVLRHKGTVLTEFISLQKIMQLDFELIEEPEKIDVQGIEEIEKDIDIMQNVKFETDGIHTKNIINPEMKEIINQLIKAVKQLDRKIKEGK